MEQVKAVASVIGQHVTVSAVQHKWQVRQAPADFLAERNSVDTGHHDIAKHDVETLGMLIQQLQGLLGIAGKHGLIPQIVQKLRREFADIRIVLHDKDVPALPGVGRFDGVALVRLNRF